VGGWLSVVYWPQNKAESGPFVWLGEAMRGRTPPSSDAWEHQLYAAIEDAGGRVCSDERVSHPMRHHSVEAFWSALSEAGPLRMLALAKGPELLDEIRADFLRRASGHQGPITHHPAARHLLVTREG